MYSWTDEGSSKIIPKCRHCGDPYDLIDAHPDTQYAGLCPACQEAAKDANDRDDIERNYDDMEARARYYSR